MRVVVLGAGGVGGYFGGRLLEAGTEVSFLVRPGLVELHLKAYEVRRATGRLG